jgi:hypothetical protein
VLWVVLTKSWRSNFSRLLKDDHLSFSKQGYKSATRKCHGHKAPAVQIKNGAMVQAGKPPTTKFMQRTASQEQKCCSGSNLNFLANKLLPLSHPRTLSSANNHSNLLNGLPDTNIVEGFGAVGRGRRTWMLLFSLTIEPLPLPHLVPLVESNASLPPQFAHLNGNT